jgi:DNA repair protein RecN (Recombination protein N)
MLLELIVENYAVVEQARIRFGEGLNVLSGETGSGKSIVVDSLGLLFGARAAAEMIRSGETRARISGIFSIEASEELNHLFSEAGIERDPQEELIVEREILSNGKSRAFVANRPVTTAFLKQLAPLLGDIHGQNEQQRLFASHTQRKLLDEYAGAETLRAAVSTLYFKWKEVGERLAEFERSEQEKLRLLDLWSFQRKEIDDVQPKAGEDAQLEADRKVLQNVTKLQENAVAAFDSLYDTPGSATAQLKQTLKRLDELTRIDNSLEDTAGVLRQASVLLDDGAFALRDYLGKLEGDPARLEEVETRLAGLDKLKRKYGGTIEDILTFRDDVAQKIDEVENASEHKTALLKERDQLAMAYEAEANKLSKLRSTAAGKLSKASETELKSLMMGGTQFQIVVSQGEWTSHGIDNVAFLVSPNRGEELKALEKIASGGELSRIALALKTALGGSDKQSDLTTLVFDEVDAGVGGAAAAAVGKRLKGLSKNNQVICVTHLAQIAGFANHHFAVSKREKKGRVVTQIDELGAEERAQEVGRMLSGERITAEALKQAEQLIQAGRAL